VDAMTDERRFSFEMYFTGAKQICLELDDGACLAKLDEYRGELGDALRVKEMKSACISAASASVAEGTTDFTDAVSEEEYDAGSASDESSELECDLCQDLTDKACLAALDEMVGSMNDKDRLTLEKTFTTGSCDDLSDADCLVVLDEQRIATSDKNRLSLLKSAWCDFVADKASSQVSVTSSMEISSCSVCSNMGSTGCLSALDDMVIAMSEMERLSFELGYDDDGLCSDDHGKICLQALDDQRYQASDDDRLDLLVTACAKMEGNYVDTNIQTDESEGDSDIEEKEEDSEDSTTAQCDTCVGLSDASCLETLDAVVDQMSDKTRLAFEKTYSGNDCDGLSDKECLALLDTQRIDASDEDRLTLLQTGCSLYLYSETDAESSDAPSEPTTDSAETASSTEASEEASSAQDEDTQADERPDGKSKREDTSCQACLGLSSKACLQALDGMVDVMDDVDRLNFEMAFEDSQCEELSDTECLAVLDMARMSAKDQDRLAMLEVACIVVESAEDTVDESPTDTGNSDAQESDTESESAAGNIVTEGVESPADATEETISEEDEESDALPLVETETEDADEPFGGCSLCADSETDTECLDIMDTYVGSLTDTERLSFELLSSAGNRCDNMGDEDCLGLLDEIRRTAKSTERLEMLESACAQQDLVTHKIDVTWESGSSARSYTGENAAPWIEPVEELKTEETEEVVSFTESASKCSLCEGLADDECLNLLDKAVGQMDDTERLSFEFFFADDSCTSLEDSDCLKALDEKLSSLSDMERFSLLSSACGSSATLNGGDGHSVKTILDEKDESRDMDFSDRTNCLLCGDEDKSWNKAAQVEDIEENSLTCEICTDMTDKICLSTLENLVGSMAADQRLEFERNYAEPSTCEDLNDAECLATLDDILANALDKERLSLMTTACAALGAFPEYLIEASSEQTSYSYEFTAAKASIDELATINDATDSFTGEITLETSTSSYSYEATDAELIMAEALTEMRMPDGVVQDDAVSKSTTHVTSSSHLLGNKKSHSSLKSSTSREDSEPINFAAVAEGMSDLPEYMDQEWTSMIQASETNSHEGSNVVSVEESFSDGRRKMMLTASSISLIALGIGLYITGKQNKARRSVDEYHSIPDEEFAHV